MKILSANKFEWVGIKDNMHVFVSTQLAFDPEIVYLKRAKLMLNEGEYLYYDPVSLEEADKSPLTIVYEGDDSDLKSYCITLELDSDDYLPAVSVSKSRQWKCVIQNEALATY